jgi:hypothetical protein
MTSFWRPMARAALLAACSWMSETHMEIRATPEIRNQLTWYQKLN